jgi:hypothetical protein
MEFSTAVSTIRQHFGELESARLNRILERCNADCEVPDAAVGTGAQSTRKRALAVQMALEGKSLDAIGQATSLRSVCVQQVLTNFAEHGFSALYPTFKETVNTEEDPTLQALWGLILPLLKEHPYSHGYRISRWTPEAVLDCLIHEEKLDDSSVHRIMEAAEPWVTYSIDGHASLKEKRGNYVHLFRWKIKYGEEEVETPLYYSPLERKEPSHADSKQSLHASLVLLGVGVGFALGAYFGGGIAARLLCMTFAIVLIWGSIFSVRRWRAERSLAKAMFGKEVYRKPKLEQASSGTSAATATTTNMESNVTTASDEILAPLPEIVIRHANMLPRTEWNVKALSNTANAAGSEPVSIVYLWVFQAHSKEQWVYETHGWPQAGPVHMLLNGAAMRSVGAVQDAMKNLLHDRESVARAVAEFKDAAGNYPRLGLFPGAVSLIEGKEKHYQGYPIHTLVCTNEVWQHAFQACAERSHFAVFNLSGYQPGHPGIEYEVAQVLRAGQPKHFAFMYDRHTDADAAIDSVLRVWQRLPQHSGKREVLVFLRYQDGQIVGYGKQFGNNPSWTQRDSVIEEGEYHPIAAAVIESVRSLQKQHAA